MDFELLTAATAVVVGALLAAAFLIRPLPPPAAPLCSDCEFSIKGPVSFAAYNGSSYLLAGGGPLPLAQYAWAYYVHGGVATPLSPGQTVVCPDYAFVKVVDGVAFFSCNGTAGGNVVQSVWAPAVTAPSLTSTCSTTEWKESIYKSAVPKSESTEICIPLFGGGTRCYHPSDTVYVGIASAYNNYSYALVPFPWVNVTYVAPWYDNGTYKVRTIVVNQSIAVVVKVGYYVANGLRNPYRSAGADVYMSVFTPSRSELTSMCYWYLGMIPLGCGDWLPVGALPQPAIDLIENSVVSNGGGWWFSDLYEYAVYGGISGTNKLLQATQVLHSTSWSLPSGTATLAYNATTDVISAAFPGYAVTYVGSQYGISPPSNGTYYAVVGVSSSGVPASISYYNVTVIGRSAICVEAVPDSLIPVS